MKLDKKYLVEVIINGFKYFYDQRNHLVYTEDLKSFSKLLHLTSNEQRQIQDQLKYPKT